MKSKVNLSQYWGCEGCKAGAKSLESAASFAFACSKSFVILFSRGFSYALKNPGEALVAGLATQVAAINAIRPITDDFLINQNTTGTQWHPSAAALSNDKVFVTWRGDQTGTYNIYGRVFDLSDPTAITTGVQVTTGMQTTGLQTTGIQVTTGMQITEAQTTGLMTPSQSTSPIPVLLGVGGAVLGVSLGCSLLPAACAIGGPSFLCLLKLKRTIPTGGYTHSALTPLTPALRNPSWPLKRGPFWALFFRQPGGSRHVTTTALTLGKE